MHSIRSISEVLGAALKTAKGEEAPEPVFSNNQEGKPHDLEFEEMRRTWDKRNQEEKRRAKNIPVPTIRALERGIKPCSALETVREFLDDDAKTELLLAGNVGIGKTFSAGVALDQTDNSYFVLASKIVLEAGRDNNFRRFLEGVSLLCIDELGKEYQDGKEFSRKLIWHLLEERRNHGHKTILTTNYIPEQLLKVYASGDGKAFLDRLSETGSIFVPTETESMRGTA